MEASVLGWQCSGSSDFDFGSWTHTGSGPYTLTISGSEADSSGTGSVNNGFQVNTPADPTLKYSIGAINDNDSGSSWTDYPVTAILSSSSALTFSSTALYNVAVSNPAGWSGTITAPLTGGFNGSEYVYSGSMDFTGTPPIGPGGELDFSYYLSFATTVMNQQVTETSVMTPVYLVPEPGTLGLLVAGLAGVLAWRRRRFA